MTIILGNLSIRNVVDIMLDIPSIPLNRLQVIMIISEAHVIEDVINVHQFLPTASKFIERLFDPRLLKAKNVITDSYLPTSEKEIIELHRKLLLLFKAYDLDFNGTLNFRELTECVKSLDLNLNPKEIKALVACAFPDSKSQDLR
jgi:hypothetical protein